MNSSQTFSLNRNLNRSSAFQLRNRKPSDFDIVTNFGTLRKRASDRDTISDKESLYYQFRVNSTTKVRMTLENRLERDPIAGFLRDRSLFGRFVNSDGDIITKSSPSAKPEETVDLTTRRLRPGTYYLELKSNFSGDIRYQLELRPGVQ